MTLPPIRQIRGVADLNDVVFMRGKTNFVAVEPCPLGGVGVINPHVTRFHNSDGSKTDVFHIKPVYYHAKNGQWRPLSEVTTHHGNHKIVLKAGWGEKMDLRFFKWLMKRQALLGDELLIEGFVLQPRHMIFATDSTFYPDPDAETTTVDGSIQYSNATWSTCRGAATGDGAFPSNNDVECQTARRDTGDSVYRIRRWMSLFNTAAITDTDSISAVTYSLYYTGIISSAEKFTFQDCNPASNTNITTADYDAFTLNTPTEYMTRVAYNTISTGAYTNHSFNASGISAISKTGITKIGGRHEADIDNDGTTSTEGYLTCRTADYTGTTSDPKLVVTHGAASSGPAKLKTRDTIAKASVKTVDTIAIASVKTIDTIGS